MRGTRAIQAGGTARVALRASNRNGTRMIRCFGVTFPRKAPMTMSPTPIRNGAKTTESQLRASPFREQSKRRPCFREVEQELEDSKAMGGEECAQAGHDRSRKGLPVALDDDGEADVCQSDGKAPVDRGPDPEQEGKGPPCRRAIPGDDDQGEQGQREQHRSGHQERDHQQRGEGDDDRRRPLAPRPSVRHDADGRGR